MEPHQDVTQLNEHLVDHDGGVAPNAAATLVAAINDAKAAAAQLTAHLASETVRAGALTAQLATAERMVAEIGADGEQEKPKASQHQAKGRRC